MVISVFVNSPTTLYSSPSKYGCFVKFPAKSSRVPILFSSNYLVKSVHSNPQSSFKVIGKPKQEGSEFAVGVVKSTNSDIDESLSLR